MPIVLLLIGILLLVLLTTVVKLDAFLSFILVAIFMGIVSGMELSTISGSIIKGMGNTLGFLAIILGFGLSIVARIVQEHGGSVTIESEQERGTSFVITLPITSQEEVVDELDPDH